MKVDISQKSATRAEHTAQTSQSGSTSGAAFSGKSLNELSPGDKFKARVTDIKFNQVTIRLDNGSTLTAKSRILPEARIGEDAIFLVKENAKGQILLEMVKPDINNMENNILKEALANAGLYPNNENLDIARVLINNNMPIDSATLQKAAFFYYAGDNLDIDKMIFLLQEKFLPVEKNIELLNGVMDKTLRLGDSLKAMSEMILDIEDGDMQRQLLGIILDIPDDLSAGEAPKGKSEAIRLLSLLSAQPGNDDKQAVVNRLTELMQREMFVELKDNDKSNPLNSYYKSIYDKASKMKEAALSAGLTGEVTERLGIIMENIGFMNHINNYKEYLQIPFSVMGQENQGELFVFKDKKGGRSYTGRASILISMDYLSLGHVEIYINKSDKTLNFQFRSDYDRSLRAISDNFPTLSSTLNNKGYTITGCAYKKINEPFSITQTMDNEDKKGLSQPKRYSFDMRV